jgi:hypothetical protein
MTREELLFEKLRGTELENLEKKKTSFPNRKVSHYKNKRTHNGWK